MVEAATPGQTPSQIGPYRIIRRLGGGGMGVVYLGQDETGGQLAAVKLIRPELAANEEFRTRLRREVAALKRVPRFCTAPVLAADTEAATAWVATEYIDAPTLDVLLTGQGGRLPGAALEALAVGVAVALRALHEHGVIHRDLKPSNIVMSAVGPRVIDFGIARMDDAAHLTRTGDLLGTLAYVAPELLEGRPATKAVDVYSWGCVVTLAGTGRLPFGEAAGALPALLAGTSPEVGDLEEPLRSAVLAALARDPSARPTAAELVDRLMAGVPQVATQVLDAAPVSPPSAAAYPPNLAVPPTAAVAYPQSAPPTPAYPQPAPPTAYPQSPPPTAYPQSAPPTAYPQPAPPTSGGYPTMVPASPASVGMPMGQPGYGWQQPTGYPPPAPPGTGNRMWLVAVAAVVALVLVAAGTTVAILVLRDRSGGDPGADPPTTLNPSPPGPSAPPTQAPPSVPSVGGFDVSLDPTFGSETASSGFTPDPMTISVNSGGSIDASYLPASNCRGYGAQAPDFRLRWESEGGLLRFFFLPNEDGADTGMVVNAPDGSWHCNDDSYNSLNPTVEFTSARSGQYDIWVTTYASPGEYIPGTLHITELSSVTPTSEP